MLELWVSVLMHAIIAALARLLGRSWFFPPAIFSATWAVALAFSSFVHPGGLTVGSNAIWIFDCATLALCIGSVAALPFKPKVTAYSDPPPRTVRFGESVVFLIGLAMLIALPFYIKSVRDAATMAALESFSVGARVAGKGGGGEVQIPGVFRFIMSLGIMISTYSACIFTNSKRSRKVLIWIFAITLTYTILSFARMHVFSLVSSVLSVLLLRKQVRVASIIWALAAFIPIALVMGSAVGKGLDYMEGKGGEDSNPVVEYVGNYLVGGPANFSYVLDSPELAGDQGVSYRSITTIQKLLGGNVEVPESLYRITSSNFSNVYTFYFAYWLDFRFAGVAAAAFMLGFSSTVVYLFARRGSIIGLMLFSYILIALPASPVADTAFLSLTSWIALPLIAWILLTIPRMHWRESADPHASA